MKARIGTAKRRGQSAKENGVIWVDFSNFASFGFLGVGIPGVWTDLMECGYKSIKKGGIFEFFSRKIYA